MKRYLKLILVPLGTIILLSAAWFSYQYYVEYQKQAALEAKMCAQFQTIFGFPPPKTQADKDAKINDIRWKMASMYKDQLKYKLINKKDEFAEKHLVERSKRFNEFINRQLNSLSTFVDPSNPAINWLGNKLTGIDYFTLLADRIKLKANISKEKLEDNQTLIADAQEVLTYYKINLLNIPTQDYLVGKIIYENLPLPLPEKYYTGMGGILLGIAGSDTVSVSEPPKKE